jgi:hypothetical protein
MTIGSMLAGVMETPCGILTKRKYDSANAMAMHSAPKISSRAVHWKT